MTRSTFFGFLKIYRKPLILIITPALLSLLFLAGTEKDVCCAYVVVLMAVLWITDALPLAMTALLPVVLFPLTGVLQAKQVAPHYLNDNNFLFVGSLFMAVAVEESRLHERLALGILLLVGSEPRWLLMGFMTGTAFLSMWMSNTATTAMMLPIAIAVSEQMNTDTDTNVDVDVEVDIAIGLGPSSDNDPPAASAATQVPAPVNTQPQSRGRIDRALLLSLCYSANIGGMSTLTGTGTNLVLTGQLHTLFPDERQISFVTWMAFAVPPVIVCLLMAWIWLQLLFVRKDGKSGGNMKCMLQNKYKALGPTKWHERIILCLFLLLILLWLFRNPQVFPGWGIFFPKGYVSDATSAMFVATLLFILPRHRPSLQADFVYVPLMTWATVRSKFEWGTVMLLGGGYAMAAGVQSSGLSDVISDQLLLVDTIPDWLFLTLAVTIVTFLTEFSSNVATASIFLPLMASLAEAKHSNPLYYMLPVTMACSFAFMLPVATPPNAIVYSSGVLKVTDMAVAGFGMNIGCIVVSVVTAQTWGYWLFNLGVYPDWAGQNQTSLATSTLYTTASFIHR